MQTHLFAEEGIMQVFTLCLSFLAAGLFPAQGMALSGRAGTSGKPQQSAGPDFQAPIVSMIPSAALTISHRIQ
ncbi:hypothetical protein D9O50_11170 [Oxalobacteraceae bacterium CAVE-383]|nr:hypothetical protein D9O50_11170 [Oxalobacteraceae bacterium CAVE-383]